MRNKLPNIASNNGRFRDGNPATGELGTVVTATWLNDVQDSVQDVFDELNNVLGLARLAPNSSKKNQIAEAIGQFFQSKLTADTGSGSSVLAFSAAGAKTLAQKIAQNQQEITRLKSSKVDKTAISNSVNSTSQTNIGSSLAVKVAYDKAVEAKNAADAAQRIASGKQSFATTLRGYGITDAVAVQSENKNTNLNGLLSSNTVWGTAGRERDVTRLPSSIYNYGVGLALSASGANAMLYFPHSHQNGNNGVWVQTSFSGNNAQPFWYRIDGADWGDIRNPVNASTTRRGLAQYTDNVNFDSSDWGASAKALRTVNIKAETAQRTATDGVNKANTANNNANRRVSKSGDTMTGHLQIKNGDWSSVRLFNSQQKFLILEAQPDTQGGSFGALIYRDAQERNLAHLGIPQKNGTLALESETVNKAGDTMSDALRINATSGWANLKLGTKQGFWQLEVHPDSHNGDDCRFNMLYSDSSGKKYLSFPSIGNGETVAYQSWVSGNYTPREGGYAVLNASSYGGIVVDRPSRDDKMLIESHGNGFAFIRRNSTDNENYYAIHTPQKSGTLLLDNDLTGAMMYFAMSSAPAGWLKANGAAVSRTTYAALFAKIGITFGAGDGRTTFNLPDLRGEFVRGWDDGRNVDSGRRFGSGQLASVQPLSSNGSQFVMGLANKDNNPSHIWSRSQHDKIAKGSLGYQDVKANYMSTFDWHGRNQIGFVNNGNNNVEFGAMRPRNVALLACIKY